jgi:serine/threonine protein phosphatase PrpC
VTSSKLAVSELHSKIDHMTKIEIEQFGLTDIGNVRKANEDNFGFMETPNGPLFTVCDGMGGHVGGATASKIAVDNILRIIANAPGDSPSVEINNAIVSANKEILDTASANPELKGMGTTCTVMLVTPASIHIGHVGDSRIYLLSKNKLHRITKDHSFVQTLVDAGAINDSEAESHPRKNELTKALGVRQSVEPTVNHHPIQPSPGDVFMLCSDGLCGLVSDRMMEDIILRNHDLQSAATSLINAAKSAGGYDNITVQLVRIVSSPYSSSIFEDFSPRENLARTLTPQMDNEPAPAWQSPPKSSVNMKLMILVGVVALLLGLGLMYIFTRESNSSNDDNTDSVDISATQSGGNDISNNNINTTQQMPNDSIDEESGRLYHHVDAKEKESTITAERQNHPAYSDYDFSKTIRLKDGSVAKDDIQKGEWVYWNKKKSSPQAETQKQPAGEKKQNGNGGENKQPAITPPVTPTTDPSQGSTEGSASSPATPTADPPQEPTQPK